ERAVVLSSPRVEDPLGLGMAPTAGRGAEDVLAARDLLPALGHRGRGRGQRQEQHRRQLREAKDIHLASSHQTLRAWNGFPRGENTTARGPGPGQEAPKGRRRGSCTRPSRTAVDARAPRPAARNTAAKPRTSAISPASRGAPNATGVVSVVPSPT